MHHIAIGQGIVGVRTVRILTSLRPIHCFTGVHKIKFLLLLLDLVVKSICGIVQKCHHTYHINLVEIMWSIFIEKIGQRQNVARKK